MADEKKVRKPRTTKKAGAGTGLPVEDQAKTPSVEGAASVTADKIQNEPAKAPAKRGRKKAADSAKSEEPKKESLVLESAEAKEVAPTQEESKKRGRKKAVKAEELKGVKEEPALNVKKEEPKSEAEVKDEKSEILAKEPAKRGRKKTVKAEENAPALEAPAKTEELETVASKKEAPEKKKQEKKDKPQENKQEKKPAPTKAEKKDFVKKLTRQTLQTERKWSELVDLVAQGYKEAYPIPENDNLNDVKGRVGSVLHVMQEEGEIVLDGNSVKLASAIKNTENTATVSALNVEKTEKKTEEKPAAQKPAEQHKSEEKKSAPAPTDVQKVQASAPAPVFDLSALFEKKKAPKKAEESDAKKAVSDVAKEKAEELSKTGLGGEKSKKLVENPAEKAVVKAGEKAVVKATEKAVVKTEPIEKKLSERAGQVRREVPTRRLVRGAKTDPLKDAFLKKLRSLGGNYFEYYAIYLLERYSRMNGRRLEGLRVSGGEYDGGIDGELELTDRLGFRETIYVQAKNWEPTDEKWWIGETILQQFIGAVAYRKVKEGKQHCRGIFITTSAFTAGAKEMLDKMSDQFVGYDGDELYETAKECQFGLIQDEKGAWKVDEELLSGKKSFFFML